MTENLYTRRRKLLEQHSSRGSGQGGGLNISGVRYLMIEQFCQHLRYRGMAAATIRRRRETLEQVVRHLAPTPLERATMAHLEAFLGSKRSARTKHAYRSDLRVFYAWALSRELVEVDPAVGLESIRVPKSLPRPIDPAQATAMLLYGRRRVRRMVALALYAGLRTSEVASLQCEDCWSHASPPVVVVRNGKGGKDRSIPMHPVLHDLLSDLAASGPVFPGARPGRSITSETASRAMARHMLACGISGTPHQLRHSFGTGLARASGGDMVLTAELMGHESMNTTMGYVRLAHSGGAEIISRMYPEEVA